MSARPKAVSRKGAHSAVPLQSATVRADDADRHPKPGGEIKLGSLLANHTPIEPADFE